MSEPYNPGRAFSINPPGYKTNIIKLTKETLAHGAVVRKVGNILDDIKDVEDLKEVWE